MSIFKLCKKDPLINLLRDTFQANPVRIPEERIKPLTIIAAKKDKFEFIGNIEHLFKLDHSINISILESQMANVSATKSRSVDLNLGLQIMDGFLKGMGCSSASLDTHFNDTIAVSFSFRNVKRKYVDRGELLKELKQKKFDKDLTIITSFIKDQKKCIMITDIITSNNFSIAKTEFGGIKQAFNLPELQGYFSSTADIKVETSGDLEISFTGEKELAFAFVGVELGIDEDGSIYSDTAANRVVLTAVPNSYEDNTKQFIIEEFGMLELD